MSFPEIEVVHSSKCSPAVIQKLRHLAEEFGRQPGGLDGWIEDPPPVRMFAVVDARTGAAVGSLQANGLPDSHVQIGVWIDPEHRVLGIAQAAAQRWAPVLARDHGVRTMEAVLGAVGQSEPQRARNFMRTLRETFEAEVRALAREESRDR